jgi:photosystem II stability/assembly factor-like uncharacterized protein
VGHIEIDHFNPDHLLIATGGLLRRSTDGGKTFEPKLAKKGPFKIKISRLVEGAPIYAACGWNSIYRSDDGGESWNGPLGNGFTFIQDMDACDAQPNVVYAAINSSGHLYRSDNSGDTWKAIGTSFSGIGVEVAADPTHPMHAVAHFKGEGLFVTWDGGDTWAPSIPGVPSSIIREVEFLDFEGLWVGVATKEGFYLSKNGGVSFAPQKDGMGAIMIRALEADPKGGGIAAGVVGGGVFEATWSK